MHPSGHVRAYALDRLKGTGKRYVYESFWNAELNRREQVTMQKEIADFNLTLARPVAGDLADLIRQWKALSFVELTEFAMRRTYQRAVEDELAALTSAVGSARLTLLPAPLAGASGFVLAATEMLEFMNDPELFVDSQRSRACLNDSNWSISAGHERANSPTI